MIKFNFAETVVCEFNKKTLAFKYITYRGWFLRNKSSVLPTLETLILL